MRLRPRRGDHPGAADRGGVAARRHLQAEILQEVRRLGQMGGLRGHYRRIRVSVKFGGE